MLKGRLGLETARVPYSDRHGLMWLDRGKLYVENGTLTFVTAGSKELKKGVYQIPYQKVSTLLVGPGSTISHDAFRILARHGTGIIIVGSNGVRHYASMPFGPDRSELARKQTELWSDKKSRINVVHNMYSIRLGENLTPRDMNSLRGIEGKRMKAVYRRLAEQYGIEWKGRRYDRTDPESDNCINKAINHASTAMRAAGMIAVRATETIPQLGFIHESAGIAFPLDIADLFRASVMLPVAFRSAKKVMDGEKTDIEKVTRINMGRAIQEKDVIPEMIDKIKELLNGTDNSSDT